MYTGISVALRKLQLGIVNYLLLKKITRILLVYFLSVSGALTFFSMPCCLPSVLCLVPPCVLDSL
jgi:hypothetical protein